MSNTLTNPSVELGGHDVGMFYVDGMYDENPAAVARAEYLQHQYADTISTPDPETVEAAAVEVQNAYAAPSHSEAAVMQQVAETAPGAAEALAYTHMYGSMLERLRTGASDTWGVEGGER